MTVSVDELDMHGCALCTDLQGYETVGSSVRGRTKQCGKIQAYLIKSITKEPGKN